MKTCGIIFLCFSVDLVIAWHHQKKASLDIDMGTVNTFYILLSFMFVPLIKLKLEMLCFMLQYSLCLLSKRVLFKINWTAAISRVILVKWLTAVSYQCQ